MTYSVNGKRVDLNYLGHLAYDEYHTAVTNNGVYTAWSALDDLEKQRWRCTAGVVAQHLLKKS